MKPNKLEQEQLPDNIHIEQKQKGKKRKHLSSHEDNDFQINKCIKSEPSSDFEVPKSIKKQKHELTDNSLHEAENYLNYRVKQEQATFVEPSPAKNKKKKKLKNESSITADEQLELCTPSKQEKQNEELNINVSSFANGNQSNISETDESPKKKKKKKKKRLSVDNESSEVSEPQDRFTSEIKHRQRADSDCGSEQEHYTDHNSHLTDHSVDNNVNSIASLPSSSRLLTLNSGVNGDSLNKTSRISDRLQFEEDSADYELLHNLPKTDLPHELKQFIRCNACLTPSQALENSQCESVLSAEDEVWIVKVPHEIALSDFENINLALDGKKKIKINGKSYDSTIDTSTRADPLFLYHNYKAYIRNTHVSGILSLRNRIPKVHIPYETLMMNNESSFIPLPETKCRHPLFGIDYKKAVRVPPEIAQRLNTSTVSLNMHDKKMKNHKIKGKVELESDIESKPNIEILHSHSKKKKRKTTERVEVQSDSASEVKPDIDVPPMKKKKRKKEKLQNEPEPEVKPEVEVQSPSNKKKRKRKHSDVEQDDATCERAKRGRHEPGGADAWESELAIEKNLFDF